MRADFAQLSGLLAPRRRGSAEVFRVYTPAVPESKSNLDRLCDLVRGQHGCIWIPTFEEDYALQLVHDAALKLGRGVWTWSVIRGVQDASLAGASPETGTENPIVGLAALARAADKADQSAGLGGGNGPLLVCMDLVPHLGDERVLRLLRETVARVAARGASLVLIDHRPDLPPVLSAEAARLELALPGRDELHQIIKSTLQWAHRGKPVSVNLSRRELDTMLRNLAGLTRRQARQVVIDAVNEDRRFDASDINRVMAIKRQAVTAGGLLEYVKSPVDLSRIGGMRRLKQWLADREHALDEGAAEKGLVPPRGLLVLGVQGAGKSLCAKAIATAWHRPLLRLDAGALYDKFIGESEKRLRDALNQAEAMAPVILWIDEIEKAFAGASSQSSDGGLSRRMFGALLTWMQEHRSPVFLVATANDISALPPELLRKGRFDEIFFVDLPGRAAREQIVKIHLKRRKRDLAKFDVARLVEATAGYSGAEIEQTIIMGLYAAFGAGREVTTEDILEAAKASPPLSRTRAEQIQELRAWGKERCRPADVVE